MKAMTQRALNQGSQHISLLLVAQFLSDILNLEQTCGKKGLADESMLRTGWFGESQHPINGESTDIPKQRT